MDQKKSGRNQQHHQNQHHHHHSLQQSQHQQHQLQQHQQQQQQQQQQQHQPQHQIQSQNQHQPYGRLKGATKILSAERSCLEQEQHPTKQPQDPLASVAMDTSSLSNNLINVGGGGTLDRCNTSNTQNVHSVHAANLLYVGSGANHANGSDLNPSSSSYNIQSHISTATTTTLAPQPIVATSNTAVNADSAISPQQQQQQQSFDSPQLQPYDIKSLFECPICFDYAVPPIYQCQNGHLVCQTCSSKIAHCPTCRVPITEPSIRNLQLDKLANQFQFPCKYNFNGCQWKSYWFKKREHEEGECEFISYSCPCPGTSCKWTGLLSKVMPHLSEHHKSITTLSGEDIVFLATDINLKGAVDWVMIQSCFNHHFLLVLEKQELKNGQQQFFAIVQLIGTPKEAEKFKYKLELSSNLSGQLKRLQWEAAPRSILDGIQFAISNYDCLVFDSRMAQHFLSPIKREKADSSANNDNNNANQSENLGINVTIERIL